MKVLSSFIFLILTSWAGQLMAQGTCQCGLKGGDSGDYIAGGYESKEHENPWQVFLQLGNDTITGCGGTLISSTHVLTAAHCVHGREPHDGISLLFGQHRTISGWVKKIIKHPSFKLGPGNPPAFAHYDFAILTLDDEVTFNNSESELRPACLPTDRSVTYDGVKATVSGWGQLTQNGKMSDVLRAVDVTVTTNTKCNDVYDNHPIIDDNMICAVGSGNSCPGDSGGPLVAPENGDRQALIGVVSFGKDKDGTKCEDPGIPHVFARVTEQMDWILENTAGTFSSACDALN